MLKTLCAMLISILTANAHAQTARINNMDARKFREASASIMKSEMKSHPKLNDRIALFRQSFFEHQSRHTPATQVMYQVTRELIENEAAQKTVLFKSSSDPEARKLLSKEIKTLNEALSIYDFTSVSSSRSARNIR